MNEKEEQAGLIQVIGWMLTKAYYFNKNKTTNPALANQVTRLLEALHEILACLENPYRFSKANRLIGYYQHVGESLKIWTYAEAYEKFKEFLPKEKEEKI